MVPGLKDGGDALGKDLVGPEGWRTGVDRGNNTHGAKTSRKNSQIINSSASKANWL